MRFAGFVTLAFLSVSSLGADMSTLHAHVTDLVNSCTALRNEILSFPTATGLGTVVAAQRLVTACAQPVSDLNRIAADAKALESPVSEAEGLQLVNLFAPVGRGAISTLRALQNRQPAIAALPSVGPISAVAAVRQALTLGKKSTDAFSAALTRYAFTGAALDAWHALVNPVIDQEIAAINAFSIV